MVSITLAEETTIKSSQKQSGLPMGFDAMAQRTGSQLMSYEPVIQMSLDDVFRTHARIHFETRTTVFQAKSGDYSEDLLSVYVTVRRFDSFGPRRRIQNRSGFGWSSCFEN